MAGEGGGSGASDTVAPIMMSTLGVSASKESCSRATRKPLCWRCAPTLLEDEMSIKSAEGGGIKRKVLSLLPNSVCDKAHHMDAKEEEFFMQKTPFQPSCAFVLAVVNGGIDWHNHYRLNQEVNESIKETLFQEMDKQRNADGFVTSEEFELFFDSQATYIKERLPERFRGLIYPDLRKYAFKHFDVDHNYKFSKGEFDRFLYYLDRLYFKYLVRCMLLSFSAFYGRGVELPDPPEDAAESDLAMLRALVNSFGKDRDAVGSPSARSSYLELNAAEPICLDAPETRVTPLWNYFHFGGFCGNELFPPGLWGDFSYYSANNHPIHGIIMCDKFHPLDWKERFMMELSTCCSTYFALWFVTHQNDYRVLRGINERCYLSEQLLSLVFATLPGMAWWYALFFLFCMPCANVNEAECSREVAHKAKICRRVGELVGHAVILTSIVMPFALGAMQTQDISHSHVHHNVVTHAVVTNVPFGRVLVAVLSARLKAYIIAWVLMFFVYFNPFVAVGDPDPLSMPTTLRKLVDCVALGQWRIERLRFRALVVHGLLQLEKRDPEQERKWGPSDDVLP